jgi:hypothetical protein
MKSTDSKISSIENSPEKVTIRTEIIDQTLKMIDCLPRKLGFHAATLPAESWYFEKSLLQMIRNYHKDLPVQIDGVEKKNHTALKSIKNMPEQCRLTYGAFSSFLSNKIEASSSGINYLMKCKDEEVKKLQLLWADYCITAHREDMVEFVEWVGKYVEQGLIYTTVSLKSRGKKGSYVKTAMKFAGKWYQVNKKNEDATEARNAIVAFLLNEMKKTHQNVKMVYNVLYHGGKLGSTPMLTVGFAVNLPENEIKCIDDVRRNSELKARRVQTAYRMEKNNWKLLKRGRPVSVRKSQARKFVDKNLSMKLSKIRMKYASYTIPEKRKIADGLGMSLRCLGAMMAHLTGKFLARRMQYHMA